MINIEMKRNKIMRIKEKALGNG
jgi:hypothetical protein